MNYLVVGAGNASRPVARLLNYLGHKVVITDLKDISEFKIEFQRSLIEMEKEGVILDLPNKDPSVEGFDAVYMPPTLPETAPIAKKVKNSDLKILTNEEFSRMVNDHGTIGLLDRLDIKIGLLTNIAEDHLSEFGGSLERYQQRKLVLQAMSETFIANNSCRDIIESVRDDAIFYALDEDVDFRGTVGDKSLTIKSKDDEFTTPFNMMSYFFENSVAASAVALTYGVKKEDIIDALTVFKGLPAHMEDVGDYNGRKVILDSAFLYDGMKITLDYFKDESVVLFLDHFDTLSVRDKAEVGELVSGYDIKVVIASGFNEVTQEVEMEAAQEILDAITNPNIEKVAVENIEIAACETFKYSVPGDIILHMGPLIAYDRITTVDKIMKGLEKGSKIYE